MKYKLEEVHIPMIEMETVEGITDYAAGEPQIRIKGYKNRAEIKVIETSEVTIRLSGLPQELQDLWEEFETKVENWVKEKEEK